VISALRLCIVHLNIAASLQTLPIGLSASHVYERLGRVVSATLEIISGGIAA